MTHWKENKLVAVIAGIIVIITIIFIISYLAKRVKHEKFIDLPKGGVIPPH